MRSPGAPARATVGWLVGAVLVFACSGGSTSPETAQTSPSSQPSDLSGTPEIVLDLPGAVAVGLASNGAGASVASWTTHDVVMAATVDLEAGELGPETEVSGGLTPFPHPIERPAVTVGPDGEVTIAFIALAEGGESVYVTTWDGEEVSSPELISGPPRPETVLVHATNDPDGEPILAWLETSTLSVGFPAGGSIIEHEEVDDLTCDCCNPVPIFFEDDLIVAYRDFDRIDGEIVRDVVAKASDGEQWSDTLAIADDHWFIDACPFSGPATVVVDEGLVVAWMDARQSVHPDQSETTIWVDRSEDGGQTFGVDLAVTSEGIHHWPVMAVDGAGHIHLVWETQGGRGGLSHAISEDGGRSFSEPTLLVAADSRAGSPTSPTVVVHGHQLLVSWADGSGGHIAVWPIDENGGQ